MFRTLLLTFSVFFGLWATTAAADLSIDGPCVQNHRWTAVMINQGGGGLALYNECAPSGDMLYMACRPGSDAVELTIEYPFTGLTAQDPLSAEIMVDGRGYPVTGRSIYSEMLGAGHPEFVLSRSDPLFAALGAGSQASVTLGLTTFAMHLSGSADTMSAMFEACP